MVKWVHLERASWRGFKRGHPAKGWVARAHTGNDSGLIEVRAGVTRIPYLGVRVLRHEIEHLSQEDFGHNSKHHDDPRWAIMNDAAPHYCGRATSWRGLFSGKHLKTTKGQARRLIKNGRLAVTVAEVA